MSEFETGAQTYAINSLILFVDNTRELAELRDKIWQQSGGEHAPLIKFAEQCVAQYNRENVSDEPLKLSIAQHNDFVDLYSAKYYEDWLQENILNASDSSEPVLDVLKNCSIDGMVVKLPPKQLERSLYTEVKDKLEKIGGKWKGGKVQGFAFAHDPAELLQQIANGAKRNLKQEFQFFETPEALADKAIEKAEIEEGMVVLEPEAGRAALIKAMRRKGHLNQVWCWELDKRNHPELEKYGCYIMGTDFVDSHQAEFENFFDRIIANPPFTNNQDIDHIRQMWEYLKPGGKLVSYASIGWTFNKQRKPTEFREWIDTVDAEIEFIEAGAFQESGTNVKTVLLVINKPK